MYRNPGDFILLNHKIEKSKDLVSRPGNELSQEMCASNYNQFRARVKDFVNHLRHAKFAGLRDDKDPRSVTKEEVG